MSTKRYNLALFPLVLLFISSQSASIQRNDDVYTLNLTLSHAVLVQNPKLWQVCTAVKMERDEEYIVGFQSIFQRGVVHHLSVHVCGEPYSSGDYWDCSSHVCANKSNWYPVWEWGREANDWMLPEGTGIVIGGKNGGKYIILQVHRKDDFADHVKHAEVKVSGMSLSIRKSRPPMEVGQLVVGNYGIIPAHVENYNTDSSCPWPHEQPIRLIGYSIHTHSYGKAVSGYIIKNGQWIELGRGNPSFPEYLFDLWQRNMYVEKGDILASRCVYSNPGDKIVKFGSTHADEMCNVYVHYAFPFGLPYRHLDCGQDAVTYHWEDHFTNIPVESTNAGGNTDQARAGLHPIEY